MQIKRYTKSILFSLVTTYAFFVDYNLIFKNLAKMKAPFNTPAVVVSIVAIFLYQFYSKKVDNKKNKSMIILSILLSSFILIGDCFIISGSLNSIFGSVFQLIHSIIKFIGYYIIISNILDIIHKFLENSNLFNYNKFKTSKKFNKYTELIFEKKPFLLPLAIILFCWIPYIISYYPGIITGDPEVQIRQYFGETTFLNERDIIIDESVTITNHHPIIHTLLLGGTIDLGQKLGNDNLGIFIYSIIQMSILSGALAYSIKFLKRIKTPYWLRYLILLIYCFVPMFPSYAMTPLKDVIFSSLILLYIIFISEMNIVCKEKKLKIKYLIKLFILLLLIFLFRNNGLHVILLSFPFLIFIAKNNKLKISIVFILFICFTQLFSNVILPYYKITPTSKKEMLSIPFQQTARYVKYYNKDVTEKEKQTIDKILNYETLANRYNPVLSDPVKKEYNKYTTDEDLEEYYKVWFNHFLKHPGVYIEASLNNTFGYFSPNFTKGYVYYTPVKKALNSEVMDYSLSDFEIPRKILGYFARSFIAIPVIGLISNLAFSNWILLFITVYLISKKKFKELIIYTPLYASVLICLASPANAHFRYAMPIVFSIPISFCIFINLIKNKSLKIRQ